MNRIVPIYQLTESMLQLLSQEIDSHNREEVIDIFQKKMEERGQLLEAIAPPYTQDEDKLGKAVVQMNQDIEQKIKYIFFALKNEMKQVQQQKKSTTSYSNPYKNIQSMDGMFLDQKK
ncbi:flagellar protein [Oceanobacillus jeddahense]|uniref:Flagellar protein FliT n=1 Tax=Oceanobacillus jeddahense TaxID=1462527 RepID=A0ABY5JPW6_9BACI|nr:flagellar protein [Oceanobacillus jeddahense]UUI02146.1 flagellar protein FliT [Oceanobacillus jeddahense]